MNDAHPAGGSGRLEVRITRKAYAVASGGRLEVLRDIDLTLARGEVGALVGPSGCGKTTMLKVIAGLDRDYQGAVHSWTGARLGVVFQEPRLLPWRSVEDNVRLAAPDLSERALSELFDALDLSGHRAHYPGELLLGLARRAALARAFAVEPDLLLLDEPFVSLDEALAARLREGLVRLVEDRAVTTLTVTHNVDEAVRLADRLFLLSARPASILADVSVPTPRAKRTEAEIAAIKTEIATRS